MPDTKTAKHRTVTPLHPRDADDGIPVSRPLHERSGEFATAVLGQVDKIVSAHLDEKTAPMLKSVVTEMFDHFGEEILKAAQDSNASTTSGAVALPPPGTSSRAVRHVGAPWIIVGFLVVVLALGAWFATWDKVQSVQASNKALSEKHVGLAERQSALEQERSDDNAYDRSVAHYLVLKAQVDYDNALNQDKMLRAIAAQLDVDVSSVPAPKQIDPPTVVQDKNREFKASRGE